MWMKVRQGGIPTLVVLLGASLLHTSTSFAAGRYGERRTLNLRVPSSSSSILPVISSGRVAAWIVTGGGTGTSSLRAVHALTAESVPQGAPTQRTGQVVLVAVRIGRRAAERVLTNAATVSSLLDALGVAVHRLDQVKPDPQSALAPGTRVRVIRVRKYRLTEVEPLPFSTLIQNSKDLELGQVKVLTPGIPGQARVTYLITSRNGREVSREVLTEVVLTSPTDQVEQHGTAAPSVQGGVDYGDASWYDWSGCGSGYHAAHRTLPFGTLVTVTNLDNGKTVTVTINDRGPYITGRVIDLCPTAFSAIAPLGQGIAHVKISW